MRKYTRGLTTLVGVVAAGCLIWYLPHFNRFQTGGYWAVTALIVVAGALLGISQLHGRDGNPLASFLITFLPLLVASAWVMLASQPRPNWVRDHVLSWSDDLGIGHGVYNLGEHVAVVAFALGVVFGLTFEVRMLRRAPKPAVVAPPPAVAPPVGDPSVSETVADESAWKVPADLPEAESSDAAATDTEPPG